MLSWKGKPQRLLCGKSDFEWMVCIIREEGNCGEEIEENVTYRYSPPLNCGAAPEVFVFVWPKYGLELLWIVLVFVNVFTPLL